MAASIRTIDNNTELDRSLNRDFTCSVRSGYVEVGEDNICLPIYYRNFEEKIRKFKVRNDDIYLLGHPKTGTTWAEEMLWLIANDLDYVGSSKMAVYKRFLQLELPVLFDYSVLNDEEFDFCPGVLDSLENCNSPRCIKSHLIWSLLPEEIQNGTKQPKIIVIFRNAEDTCVSLFHHSQWAEGYKGSFEDFCELFLAGRVCFGPFWKTILSYWQQRDRPNILIIKYAEMKNDLLAVVKKVALFLGKTLSEDQVDKLVKHLSFESMKKNPALNHEKAVQIFKNLGVSTAEGTFIRSGKVGAFKNVMSPELTERFKACTRSYLEGTGLSLD